MSAAQSKTPNLMVVQRGSAKSEKHNMKVEKSISKGPKVGEVDADHPIDEDARYVGTVDYYDRRSGYGFIAIHAIDVVKGNRVMVHWKELQSSDRWPYLYKGLQVEFGLKIVLSRDRKTHELKAKQVSLVGGEEISLQEESDDQREFVGGKKLRFMGNVKFYDNVKGFGYMVLQEGYELPEGVPTDLRISREEIHTAPGSLPRLREAMECEFGIVKSPKGVWSCYNITLPEGELVNREAVEQREELKKTLTGKIALWKADNGFGYIELDNLEDLPKSFRAKLKESTAKHEKKSARSDPIKEWLYFNRRDRVTQGRLYAGDEVTFSAYTDYRGVGAFDVAVTKSVRGH